MQLLPLGVGEAGLRPSVIPEPVAHSAWALNGWLPSQRTTWRASILSSKYPKFL